MYRFSCSCEETFPVSPAHAGQSTSCPHCGKKHTLPKLGELRKLPLIEDQAQEAAARWSGGRGVCFAIFAAIMMVSVIFGGICSYKWMSMEKPPSVEELTQTGYEDIDKRGPTHLFDFWLLYVEPGLSSRKVLEVEFHRANRNRWIHRSYICYAGIAIALVGIWISMPKKDTGNQKE